MKEEDIQNSVKDLITEPIKSIPKKMIAKQWDKKQFEQMFVAAGKAIADFEWDGTEESELRRIFFSEENMQAVAEYMYSQDFFRWFQILQQGIHAELEQCEMSAQNRENCEAHFLELIGKTMRARKPEIVSFSMQQETVEGVRSLGEQNSQILEIATKWDSFMREYYEERDEARQNQRQNVIQDRDCLSEKKWNLSHTHVEGIFLPQKERRAEILKLTEMWARERDAYPGWYIPPYAVCRELNVHSRDNGLLQSEEFVENSELFAFVYELVWRYEMCMHHYSSYEIQHIYRIWREYDEHGENVVKWFYVGQALLRVFRENGKHVEWKSVYDQLKAYEDIGVNGKVDLRLEKVKHECYSFNIPALRRAISKCHPKKENYEQRLQILGIRLELDETEEVVNELERLILELQDLESENEKDRLYYESLEACVLQLYSFSRQGMWDVFGEYEKHLEEINQIQKNIEAKKMLFDWNHWINNVQESLLSWHVRKHEQKEAFELNREIYTFISSSDECEPAYRFYRILEKLALPLECGYVNLLGDMEKPWVEAMMDQADWLGVILLCREAKSSTVKTLVDREYIGGLKSNKIGEMVGLLIRSLSQNLEEMAELEHPHAGGILSRIRENVPELLVRFMSRCPDELQESALLLLKDLMESEKISDTFPMTQLCVSILDNVSEKKKAQMLDTMMQTKIIEYRTVGGYEEGIDIFSFYFRKEDIGPLKKVCSVKQDTIEWLLIVPNEAGYEWETKVWRLKILDKLGLLNESQHRRYVTLLWKFVDEKKGLPKLSNVHMFVYEELPCIDAYIPAKSIKQWLLSKKLKEQFADEEGCKGTMGETPYLDEMILLCDNGKRDYWTTLEVGLFLQEILTYWDYLKLRLEMKQSGGFVRDEYLRRARKMVRAATAICRNSQVSQECKEKLQQMIEEMQQRDISTRELEVQIVQEESLIDGICEQMLSPDNEKSVDAMLGAYYFMLAHPQEQQAQYLFEQLLNLLKYRKVPGLVSAVFVLQNLAYEKCSIMQGTNLNAVDKCLAILADSIQIETNCGLDYKEILHVRKACMALAFQLYQQEDAQSGVGVQRWKTISEDDREINEVKQEWVW